MDEEDNNNKQIRETSKLAQKEYNIRYDWVKKVINKKLCNKFKFDHTNKWYIHKPVLVRETETQKILLDFEIQTDNLITARRPDKKKKKKKRTYRIEDFAFRADHSIKLKESEKRDKYFDLARELKIKTMERRRRRSLF